MYSDIEIAQIRDAISWKLQLTGEEKADARAKLVSLDSIPAYAEPFALLAGRNPELYDKLVADPEVQKYSKFGFFPESFPLVYGSETPPQMRPIGRNRGLGVIVEHPEKSFVIKPYQSLSERKIAGIAAEVGGPRQLATLDGYLTEEFIDGELLGKVKDPQRMQKAGRKIGEIFSGLHARDVFYNDNIADDFGECHVIIPENGDAVLVDYGVAIDMSAYPELDDESVFNFYRTMIEYSFTLPFLQPEQIKDFIASKRPELRANSKAAAMQRDFDFVKIGAEMAAMRHDSYASSQTFFNGFLETYQS